MALIYISLLLTLIFFWYHKSMRKYRNIPPGPFALPLIGSIPFLKGKGGIVGWMVDESLYKYGKDFCTVWIGMIPFIWVQDFELTKELFAKDEFSARLDAWYARNIHGSNGRALGISWESGRFWQDQRRFALKHLKELGFGKQSLDIMIQDEVKDLINTMITTTSKNVHKNIFIADGFFNIPVINTLWQIVASQKYDPSSSETQKIVKMLCEKDKQGHRLVDFVPIFRPFVPYDDVDRNVFAIKDDIRRQVMDHQTHLQEEDEPRDFIDIYLREIENEKKRCGSQYGFDVSTFHSEQLVVLCMDLFAAGSETTGTTLSWGVMYLALNQEVQRKCQQEIDNLLGERLPEKNDMQDLIYCMATINEIQRISCVAPGSLPHVLTRDMSINGYDFPEGSIFMANITKFSKDPIVFPEPSTFLPDRFIDIGPNGKLKLKKNKQHVPFGIGKRICLGESLANVELFIFLVMMLQRFNLNMPIGRPDPDDKQYTHGFTKAPKPFYLSISERSLYSI